MGNFWEATIPWSLPGVGTPLSNKICFSAHRGGILDFLVIYIVDSCSNSIYHPFADSKNNVEMMRFVLRNLCDINYVLSVKRENQITFLTTRTFQCLQGQPEKAPCWQEAFKIHISWKFDQNMSSICTSATRCPIDNDYWLQGEMEKEVVELLALSRQHHIRDVICEGPRAFWPTLRLCF